MIFLTENQENPVQEDSVQENPAQEPKVIDPYKPNKKGRRTSQKGVDPNQIEEL